METGSRKILVYRPAVVWLAGSGLLCILAALGYLLFNRGMHYAAVELDQLYWQQETLERQIKSLSEEKLSLTEEIAFLQRSSEIDRQASREVRDEFGGLQDELLELRKELDFYRGIVSPGDGKAGLQIQRFHLEPLQQAGGFSYSLTLTQVKRNERYVRGVIEMDVEGLHDGKPGVLSFGDLVKNGGKSLNFKFRYFQHFDGEIMIPAGFQPRGVRIRLRPSGKGQPQGIEKFVDWPV